MPEYVFWPSKPLISGHSLFLGAQILGYRASQWECRLPIDYKPSSHLWATSNLCAPCLLSSFLFLPSLAKSRVVFFFFKCSSGISGNESCFSTEKDCSWGAEVPAWVSVKTSDSSNTVWVTGSKCQDRNGIEGLFFLCCPSSFPSFFPFHLVFYFSF